MNLHLSDIRQLQSELDEQIMTNHKVTRPQTQTRRILALLVEIGELANETRCFKFWSFKKASEKEVLLEELGDCVHFTISLGIDLKDDASEMAFDSREASLSEQFIDWMDEVSRLKTSFNIEQYRIVLSYIGSVALAMGFEAQDVYDFYVKKNEINHHRQQNNY
jgi:dimeric dUTPase (all-alpha-NTP-PPase superfamily)